MKSRQQSSDSRSSQHASDALSRRTFLKRSAALAGSGLLLASGARVTSAAGGSGGAVQRRSFQGGTTEITIWTAFPELDTFLTQVGPDYSKVKSNIKVVNTLFPQRALEEKVAAALPAGEGPDLIEMDRHEIYPYYLNDQIVPFSGDMLSYVQQNWPKFAVDHATVKDELYALPWITSPKMMFYNTDMFSKAGITKPPETVDEMMSMAEKLTVKNSGGTITTQGIDLRLSGGGFGTSQKYWTQAMIPYGAEVLHTDGDKYSAGYNNDQGVAALNLYIDAVYVKKVSTFDAKHDAEGFGLGQAAMFQRESWVCDYLAKNAPDIKYDVFPMPKGPGGWGTVANTLGLGVTSSSKHQDEVYEFVKWLTNEENTAKTYAISGWQPWRTDGIDFGDLFDKTAVLKTFIDVLSLDGHTIYDYENIPPVAEIHARMADRLMEAFKDSGLAGNSDGQKKDIKDMADETNRVLKDWDLYAG
ncbi:MAG TPA: sugar ABC transporter substrate-binding protein [Thermomicrobiales bacterium]|nr:sugar ABC transporter substrate-binding protein [Thermomicrobiales bacterium]